MADTYTQFGPFTSGGAPGIDAPFLNPVETFLLALSSRGMGYANFNVSASTLTGSTSGTAYLYQFVSGVWKYVLVRLNAFRNGGGSNQTIAIPTPFTTTAQWRTGDLGGITLLSGGSARTVGIVAALSTSGGTFTPQTVINFASFGEFTGAVDTIQFNSGYSTSRNGTLIIEGI